MTDLFWFFDEQWARIAPLLPKNTRGLKRAVDRRLERHRARSEIGWAMGGLPCRLRAKEHHLQSLRPMGRARHLEIFAALAGRDEHADARHQRKDKRCRGYRAGPCFGLIAHLRPPSIFMLARYNDFCSIQA